MKGHRNIQEIATMKDLPLVSVSPDIRFLIVLPVTLLIFEPHNQKHIYHECVCVCSTHPIHIKKFPGVPSEAFEFVCVD